MFTSSKEKLADAARLGVDAVLESNEPDMQTLAAKFDFILSTVPEKHDINPFIALLKRDCTLVVVGALEKLEPVNNQAVAFGRKSVAGSLIGSLADTQEILDFYAKHRIGPDIELIGIKQINEAFSKVESGDVRFRYVIDMASLDLAEQA